MDEITQEKKGKVLRFLTEILLGFLILLLLILCVFSIGIYKFGWEGSTARKLASVIPFPVAIINGEIVSFDRFWKTEQAYEVLNGGGNREAEKLILEDLIRDQIIAALADKNSIKPDKKELERYYEYFLRQFGIEKEDAPAELDKLFGLSESQFKSIIVLPDLNLQKLRIWWNETNALEAKSRAQGVQKELEQGADLAQLARVYSQDEESKYIGGDLGFVSREEMPPWISDQVFDLQLNEISEVVTSPEGFVILQMAALDENQDPPLRQARWILFKGSEIENFLNEQRSIFQVLVLRDL